MNIKICYFKSETTAAATAKAAVVAAAHEKQKTPTHFSHRQDPWKSIFHSSEIVLKIIMLCFDMAFM